MLLLDSAPPCFHRFVLYHEMIQLRICSHHNIHDLRMQHEYECWSFVTIITVYRHEDTPFRISGKRLWRIILLRISVLLYYFPSWRRLVLEKSTVGRFCKNYPTLKVPESLLLLLSHSSPVGSATMQVVPVHTPHTTVSQLFSIYVCLLQVFLPVMFSASPACYMTSQLVNGPNYAGVLGFRIM
jgi:hypothetical protein